MKETTANSNQTGVRSRPFSSKARGLTFLVLLCLGASRAVTLAGTISVNYDITGTSTPAEAATGVAGSVAVTNWNNVSSGGSGGFTAPT